MDQIRCGAFIRALRQENGLTQRELAGQIGVTDKAVSKWERGLGCPDVSLLDGLSRAFRVDVESLLTGALPKSGADGGNMKRIRFYICPECGNILTSTGASELSCCGRRLTHQESKPADEAHTPQIEPMDDELYLTFPHEMTKAHHLRFVAWLSYDRLLFIRLYPEQDAAVRMPMLRRGRLIVCCSEHGLQSMELKQ